MRWRRGLCALLAAVAAVTYAAVFTEASGTRGAQPAATADVADAPEAAGMVMTNTGALTPQAALDSIIERSGILAGPIVSTSNHVGEGNAGVAPVTVTYTRPEEIASVRSAASLEIVTGSPLDVAVYAADYTSKMADIQGKLLGTGQFASASVIDTQVVTPTLAELQAFDAVIVYHDYSHVDADALGNVMADYVDGGGGVVCMVWEVGGIVNPSMGGRWATDGYVLMDRYDNITGHATLGTVHVPSHPIMAGVSSFDGGSYSFRPATASVYPGVTRVADWSDGHPLVSVKEIGGVNRADVTFYGVSSDVVGDYWDVSTDGALLMANALTFVAGGGGDCDPPAEPSDPDPADGAVDVPLDPLLSWEDGGGASYYENFDDGLAQGWEEIAPADWEVISGEYRADAGDSYVIMQSTYTGQTWANCGVEATMRRTGDTGSAAGLAVRATSDFSWVTDTGSAYAVGISGDQSYWVGKWISGSFEFIQSWTSSLDLNAGTASNVVKINIEGTAIDVYFNGNLAWSGSDASIADAGRIGLLGYSGSDTVHYFDDVMVTEPTAATARGVSAVQAWYNDHPSGGLDPAQAPVDVSPTPCPVSSTDPVVGHQASVRFYQAPGRSPDNVAIFQDESPWGSTWNEAILAANGISFTIFGSADMGSADLSPFDKVIVSSVQPSSFYDALETNRAWFEAYTSAGGVLDLHLASYSGDLDGKLMPGGFVASAVECFDDVTIVDAGHAVLTTPHAISDADLDGWGCSSHGYFAAVPGGADEIIELAGSGEPCAMDLFYGAGRIFATVQPVEYNYGASYNYLENTILYDLTGGGCLTTYDVYFGTENPPTTLICSDVDVPVCDPGLLECETTYYWQVCAKNEDHEVCGPVWSFTTEDCECDPPPEPSDPDPADGDVDVPVDADLAWNGGPGGCEVIEDFEDGDIIEYTEVGSASHVVTGVAAHDGSFGLATYIVSGGGGWLYRDDAAVQVAQGTIISYWARPTATGRAYCGFGATSAGTYSAVLSPTDSTFLIQRNVSYDFYDLTYASQTWTADKWYRVEVQWDVGGDITARLFDSDGTTLLNTISTNDSTYTSGGIAFRKVTDGAAHFDTVERCGAVSKAAQFGARQRQALGAVPVQRDPAEAIGWDELNGAWIFPNTRTIIEQDVSGTRSGLGSPRSTDERLAIASAVMRDPSQVQPGEPTVGPYGIDAFANRDRATIEILMFIGYSDNGPGGEAENTVNAIAEHFTDFNLTTTITEDPATLAAELAGKSVFIVPEQEMGTTAILLPIASSWAGVLQDFVSSGGTVIFCEEWGPSDGFITATGLMDVSLIDQASGITLDVVNPAHPLAAGLPATITGENATGWYTVLSPDAVSVVEFAGDPVVVAREIGVGHVALIGFDYFSYNTDMARVIANAVQWTGGGEPCPTTYDVYFGTENPPTTLICSDVDVPVCDPGLLECGTTYYWQVCAKNEDHEVCGPVWSFTTVSCCDPPPEPSDPDPADGAVDVPLDPSLSWAGGALARDSASVAAGVEEALNRAIRAAAEIDVRLGDDSVDGVGSSTDGYLAPAAGAPRSGVFAATSALVFTGNSGQNEGYDGLTAALATIGVTATVTTTFPPDLSEFCSVYLSVNAEPFDGAQLAALVAYVNGGGVLVAMGDWEPWAGSANDVMNNVAMALGSSMSITPASIDTGCHTTPRIEPHPLTAGVAVLDFGAASQLNVGAGALLVSTEPSDVPMLAVEGVGGGTFVLCTDSNLFSDPCLDMGDHAVLVQNLCTASPPCPTTYDVYFGTENPPTTLICSDVDVPVCDPGLLECGTTYYWQVCAKNEDHEVCGPVWSFTTVSCCDPPPEPSDPDPADGAVDVLFDADLAWNGGGPGSCVVVPNANATVEGDSANAWPFSLGGFHPSMRYQQIYDPGEFSQSGVITEIRFRPDDSVSPFAGVDAQVEIYLGYAATTVTTPSSTYADNIGPGYTKVLDGTLMLSSGATGGPPRDFDIIVDVDNLFMYDPAVGPLLLDIRVFNDPSTTFFDAVGISPLQTATTRIYTAVGDTVDDPTGIIHLSGPASDPYGLVTLFCFDGAVPARVVGSAAGAARLQASQAHQIDAATGEAGAVEPGGQVASNSDFEVSTEANPTDSGEYAEAVVESADRTRDPGCAGTVIDFDDIPGGPGSRSWDGSRYAAQGVIFSTSPGAGLYAFDYAGTHTPPTYVYGSNSGGSSANDKVIAELISPASCVSLYVLDTAPPDADFNISVFDSGDTLLESLTTNLDNQMYQFVYPDIKRVEFTPSSDLEAIDTFAFESGDLCPTTYDVYFGTDPGDLELICSDVSVPTCDPGVLYGCTTYYWQVCAKTPGHEVCGPVWSFTTTCACPFIYDLDNSCFVDATDLGLFAACWLLSEGDVGWDLNSCWDKDFDCSGAVNATDLGLFAGAWLKCDYEVDPASYPDCRYCEGPIICPWPPE